MSKKTSKKLAKGPPTKQPVKPEPEEESDSDEQNPSDDEFERESGNEEFTDYKPEGYHPVILGENFNNFKYSVVQKLGWGYFSTVWLVKEKATGKNYALKIQKSKKSYSEAAEDEIQILLALKEGMAKEEWKKTIEDLNAGHNLSLTPADNFCIGLIDNFVHYGMHGKHYCSVFEIMGPNLLDLIEFFEFQDRGMDIKLVKVIARQLLIGLDYMHRICGVIHTDLKPENIMVELVGKQLEEFIADVENIKKKPLSMKFLKKLQNTGNSAKNKKKYLKKKQKKAAQKKAQEDTKAETPATDATSTQATDGTATTESKEKTEVKAEPTQTSAKGDEVKTSDGTTAATTTEEKSQEATQKQGENTEKPKELEEEKKVESEVKRKRRDDEDAAQEEAEDEDRTKPSDHKHHRKEHKEGESGTANYVMKWKDKINVKIDENIKVRIVDFGNGCWVDKHFTDNIQTREYRSPEVILGLPYKANTDIWSLACVIFEMLASNYLFKPRKGKSYDKNDDHLALMMEHLGKMPKHMTTNGKYSRDYFNKNGQLLRIKDLRETSLVEPLLKETDMSISEAKEIEEFLLPMLEFDPEKRISAREALQSKWLWT